MRFKAQMQARHAEQRRRDPIVQPRTLGHVEYGLRGDVLIEHGIKNDGPEAGITKQPVRVRTTHGWSPFLREMADESGTGVELIAFMARALGHSQIPIMTRNPNLIVKLRLGPVADNEALALMEALLTTGSGLDLPNRNSEADCSPGQKDIVASAGPIYAEFVKKFTPLLMDIMTLRCDEAGSSLVTGAAEFTKEVRAMGDYTTDVLGHRTRDPAHELLASAYGAAVGALTRFHTARDPLKVRDANLLFRNSTKTVAGALSGLEADEKASKSHFMTAFAAAVGAIGAAIPGGVGMLIAAMAPTAERLFGLCLGGNEPKRRARVIDGFNNGINGLIGRIGFDPNAAERFKNTFGELLD